MPRIKYQDFNFHAATLRLIETANDIIAEYQAQGFDLTLRQLYYQFVSRDIIPNTLRSYKNLGGVINDARLAGLIDWDAIVDRTRELRPPDGGRNRRRRNGLAAVPRYERPLHKGHPHPDQGAVKHQRAAEGATVSDGRLTIDGVEVGVIRSIRCTPECSVGERNDCAVRAIAAACGVSYNEAHALLEKAGRKRRRGFAIMMLLFGETTSLFGCTVRLVAKWKYPVLTWGTLREAILACQKGRYIIRVPHHLLAIIDGKVHDPAWKGTRTTVTQIWRVETPGETYEPFVKVGPAALGPATFEQARDRLPRRRRMVCCNGHAVLAANAATWALDRGFYRCARCFEDYRAAKQPVRLGY